MTLKWFDNPKHNSTYLHCENKNKGKVRWRQSTTKNITGIKHAELTMYMYNVNVCTVYKCTCLFLIASDKMTSFKN